MKCKSFTDALPDHVMGRLNSEFNEEMEDHLSECRKCQEEMFRIRTVWHALEVMPEEEPSPALKGRFYAMLDAFKVEQKRERHREKLNGWVIRFWPRRPVFQMSFAVTLLVVGLLVGYQVATGISRNGELGQLRDEIQSMRQAFTLSLLSQSSSSERLRGVSWSTRVDQPTESLLAALMNTLNSDPDVNVRLAAADALLLFSERPNIRESLIQSLTDQTSPLLQIAIIDLLVQVKEDRALNALRRLLEDQRLDSAVKQHAEKSIEELI